MITELLILLLTCYVKCQYDHQRVPEKCHGATELLYRQCCIFPPFFKREIAKLCGARVVFTFTDNNTNVTGLQRIADDPCTHWECMLVKYSLLNADGKLDEDKYYAHLDKWVKLNPEFSNVMLNAKLHCKQLYRMYMPMKPCEFLHLQSCLRNYINVNCPKMIPSEECDELKSFYNVCREFFVK